MLIGYEVVPVFMPFLLAIRLEFAITRSFEMILLKNAK